MTTRVLLSLLLALGLISGGCGGQSAGESKQSTVIGVSMLTMTHQFFQDLTDELEKAAGERDYEVLLTSCEFDIAEQRNQVSDFIVRGVDAIVMSPCDSKAVGTTIEEANAAGIPVFTADIAALAEGAEVVSHIATDNLQGGRTAAEVLVDAIGGSGTIAVIDHPTVESVILRTRGFHEVIEKRQAAGARLEVVAQLPGGGTKDVAFRVAEDILQAHPDLDGIFCINDDTALGALAAIEKAGRQGSVVIVGFDGVDEARRAIRDGKIHADVIQHPREIGRRTIEVIEAYMSGERVPEEVLIPAVPYTKADAETDPRLASQ